MTGDQHNERPRPTRAQRLVAFGFLGAFGLTIVTVLFKGIMARSAKNRHEEPPPVAAPAEPARPAREAAHDAESQSENAARDAGPDSEQPATEPPDEKNEPAPSPNPGR